MMTIDDVQVILAQNLGMNVIREKNTLITAWNLGGGMLHEIIFFADEETGLLYISTRFEEQVTDQAMIAGLLRENLKLSFVKFSMDKEGRILAVAEIPLEILSDEILRRGIKAVYTATERFYELLSAAADQEHVD
jgi:hypothetical protein